MSTVLAAVVAVAVSTAVPAGAVPVPPGGGGDPLPPDCVSFATGTITSIPAVFVVGQTVTVTWSIKQQLNGGSQQSMDHELGHYLGLFHAQSYDCTDASGAPVPYSSTCEAVEYGDANDTMGINAGGYNAIERDRLGWLGGRSTTVPASGGSYSLSPLELNTPGQQALRIDDNGVPVWLEYRVPTGQDAGRLVYPGVLASTTYLSGSRLLDTNTSSPIVLRPGIEVGQTWISPTGNFKIRVDSESDTSAHITITLNRVAVPDVSGDSVTGAESTLRDDGLAFTTHSVTDSTCNSLGTVHDTSPPAGTQVQPGSTITLNVNTPPAPPARCP